MRLCGSRDAAEDLVQDTVERVLRSPRRLAGDPYAYLVAAVRNTHVDRVRARSRRVATLSLTDAEEPADRRAESASDAGLEARRILRAVADLPPDYRAAVVAVDVSGYSYAEAARALRIPKGTLLSRAFRGRQRIARAA